MDQSNDYIDEISNAKIVQSIDIIGGHTSDQCYDGISQPKQVQLNDHIGGKTTTTPLYNLDSDSSYLVEDSSNYETDWGESNSNELVSIAKDEQNTYD